MPSFRRRMIRRDAIGEIAALLGTTLLLLLVMSKPDWDEPAFQIVWGVTGLALVVVGSYLMLSQRRQVERGRSGTGRE